MGSPGRPFGMRTFSMSHTISVDSDFGSDFGCAEIADCGSGAEIAHPI
jgi:hypothetical protein